MTTLQFSGNILGMDKYDQLAIRACKNLHSELLLNRLRKIYGRRVNCSPQHVHNSDMLYWLLKVIEKFQVKFDVYDLIWDAHPGNNWKFGANNVTDHCELFIHVVASRIRLTEVKYIPGYIFPRKFR